jgi:hypothetical protein
MTIRLTATKFAAAGLATALMSAVATPSLADGYGRDAYARGYDAAYVRDYNYSDPYVGPDYSYDTGVRYRAPDPVTGIVGGVLGTAGAVVGSTIGRAVDPYYGRYPGYAYAPGSSDYAYAPGYGSYAYRPAPGPMRSGTHNQFEVAKDMSGQPIYAGQLSPFCNLGDKLNERC